MRSSTTIRAEEIREATGIAWELACQRAEDERDVAEILAGLNVTEPGGDWSVYDIARRLDPHAHQPRHLFDTAGPYPRDAYVERATIAVDSLQPSGRYVGGTSGHLYHA